MKFDDPRSRITLHCLDDEAAEVIQEYFKADCCVVLERIPVDDRAVDASLLIALVGAGSSGVSALLTGLFAVKGSRVGKTIRIKGRNGIEIEVPAETPPDQLEHYVRIARDLDVASIEIK